MKFIAISQKNDTAKTTVVVVDNYLREISAAETVFTNAKTLLCHFHVLRAVDARLDKGGLTKEYRHELFNLFNCALYANSEADFQDATKALRNTGIDVLWVLYLLGFQIT